MGGKGQTNPSGGLFEGFGKLGELFGDAKEHPELDKMKPALEKLKKQVDVQKLRTAVEKGNELTIVETLSPLEKLFKEVECPEAGFTDPEDIEKKWLMMKEQIVNWLIEVKEKEARQPIDEFINEASNLTGFPDTKEKAEGIMSEVKDVLDPKKLLFGGIIAWLTKEAATAKAEGGFSKIWGSICEKLAMLLGGKDIEKINALTGEMAEAIKEKDWKKAEDKANALLKEDKDNIAAKEALIEAKKRKALAAKKKKGGKEGQAPEAEKPKHEKELAELEGMIEIIGIPIAMEQADYEEVLKSSPFNGNPKNLKNVVMKGLKENGGIWSLNEAIKIHKKLKKSDFKFSLLDFLIPPDPGLEHVVKALSDADDTYRIPDHKNVTPDKLRAFLTAVRTEEGLEVYKMSEANVPPSEVASVELSGQPARTPPGADL